MKNKKISILVVVLGVVLLIVGIVLMFLGKEDKSLEKEISDECKFVLTKDGSLDLEFKCDIFHVTGDNLLFKFSKNEDSYNLDVSYNNKDIFNSKDKNMSIFTSEHAGKTSIINMDDLYLVHSYAASQCGDYGHLAVFNKSGEVVNYFNGLFDIDTDSNVVYVNEMTNEECSNVESKEGLYDQYNVVGSQMNKVGSVYEFNMATVVSAGNLEFEYGMEEDNYLNISYNGNNIFSSRDRGIMVYSEEQAGHTKISKIDDVYLVDTAAAHQCGEKGTLIVVNSNGELLGVFDSLNFDTNKQNKSISFIEDKDDLCVNLEGSELEEVTYYINGSSFSK